MSQPGYIIFTDMDGTLIDTHTYSYEKARPALKIIASQGIPLIFCTSKTRAELEVFIKEMNIHHPFIPENGGAIFIPEDYFDFRYHYDKKSDNYNVIELGDQYNLLRNTLKKISDKIDCKVICFGEMDIEEICLDSGLDPHAAALAKKREYDEPFRVLGPPEKAALLEKEIVQHGLNYTKGGRYHHIMGNNDKGKAVKILTGLFRRKWPDVKTIGLGDSLNDLPMILAVDIGIMVQKPDGSYDPAANDERIRKAKGVGPAGWNLELMNILCG